MEDKGKLVKIILAGVLGVAAILVICWNLGLFDGKPPPPPPAKPLTPEQQKDFDKGVQERQQLEKRLGPPRGA